VPSGPNVSDVTPDTREELATRGKFRESSW
jgi:hypothetical protein